MKNLKFLALLLAIGSMIFITSCKKEEDALDPTLIIGTWKNEKEPSNFKKYTTKATTVLDSTYKYGSDWTIGETTEDQEGTEFYYKIEGDQLKEQYKNMSIYLPRIYTIMKLTSTQLEYVDSYNEIFTFTKQQ